MAFSLKKDDNKIGFCKNEWLSMNILNTIEMCTKIVKIVNFVLYVF